MDGLDDRLRGHVGEVGGAGVLVLTVPGPGVVVAGGPRPGRSQLQSLQLRQDLGF